MKTLAEVIAIGIGIIQSVANAIGQASSGKLTPDEALAKIVEAAKQDQAVDSKVDAAVATKFPTPVILFFAAVLCLGHPGVANAAVTREVLVLTTVTTISFSRGSTSAELYNNGANTIWCAINATPVSGKCRPVAAGAFWSFPIESGGSVVKCLTSVSQTTGAATSVSESAEK